MGREQSDWKPRVEVREEAIEALETSGRSEIIPILVELLNHEHHRIRYSAIITLHNTHSPEVIPYLEPLVNDPAEVRPGDSVGQLARETIDYLNTKLT